MLAPDNRVQGFLGAGHVCTVTGIEAYQPFVDRFRVPVAMTGFEPIDLLYGIREVVRLLQIGQYRIVNSYSRSVRNAGNEAAQKTVNAVYEVADAAWRGFGVIREGGFQLKRKYRHFDAQYRFGNANELPIVEDVSQCRGADVLSGRIKPTECPEFGKHCRPEQPLGAPMVSSEGACAAYYQYHSELSGR
jgi:hydrogenase expression/formation protein HypD